VAQFVRLDKQGLTPRVMIEQIEQLRAHVSGQRNRAQQGELGQFMTPMPVARLMASMLDVPTADVRLLDAGAGVGSLFGASVAALVEHSSRPQSIHVTAYEIDQRLIPYLYQTLVLCAALCHAKGIQFTHEVQTTDFIQDVADRLTSPLFVEARPAFTHAILNPPYRKIHTASSARQHLRRLGIETSNLYTGFLSLAVHLLAVGGQLVAITPRSFCNGPYFRPFRELLLEHTALRHFHVFASREQAFRDDEVLQENVIIDGIKGVEQPDHVQITTSLGPADEMPEVQHVPFQRFVSPSNPQKFFHLPSDAVEADVALHMAALDTMLVDLGLTVSTGRVVDFRAAAYLRAEPTADSAALIYPLHLSAGLVQWPKTSSKKPNALVYCEATRALFIPNETYVLVRRLTSKEERRRIVATVYDPASVPGEVVGFENHLNYYHQAGRGLDPLLARGLALFLNSTLVDTYFRQFNGHTQVNATDLRALRYPTYEQLVALGRRQIDTDLLQPAIDELIAQELTCMGLDLPPDQLHAKQRIDEALAILCLLGVPKAQQNERSALTLLALVNLTPQDTWAEASDPLCGITPMMDFFARHYGKQHRPNTRETVRRQTVHQFLEAGLVVANPDDPARPINSPRAVYQIERSALELLRSYGTPAWEPGLQAYRGSVESLRQRYAQERAMQRIPITFPDGTSFTLSPGGQNVLVKAIIDDFAPRFTPGGEVLYVGDTDEKFAHKVEGRLRELGIVVDAHGKMPDVIIYHVQQHWLVLIEAVTSHGPINPKRRAELARLFAHVPIGLVYVTAFLTRQAIKEYLGEISWESEVWVAESPGHLIHFDGERFLGPLSSSAGS
jgi:adenine-specific DNA-methyltransferase